MATTIRQQAVQQWHNRHTQTLASFDVKLRPPEFLRPQTRLFGENDGFNLLWSKKSSSESEPRSSQLSQHLEVKPHLAESSSRPEIEGAVPPLATAAGWRWEQAQARVALFYSIEGTSTE